MNLATVCVQLGLGFLSEEPVLQMGGSLHRVWYVKTDRGEFTLKNLDKNNLRLLGSRLMPVQEYLKFGQQCLFPSGELKILDDQLWLIKQWVPGRCVKPVNVDQAIKIGGILRAIHGRNLHSLAVKPSWGSVDLSKWRDIVEQNDEPWANQYKNSWPIIEKLNYLAGEHLSYFQDDFVMSHRDISTSNLIWNSEDFPTLIDWEFSGWIHPELDVFITAMNFDRTVGEIFKTIIDAYGKTFSCDFTTLYAGYCGYCLDWVDFNFDRLREYPESKEVAIHQISLCLELLTKTFAQFFSPLPL